MPVRKKILAAALLSAVALPSMYAVAEVAYPGSLHTYYRVHLQDEAERRALYDMTPFDYDTDMFDGILLDEVGPGSARGQSVSFSADGSTALVASARESRSSSVRSAHVLERNEGAWKLDGRLVAPGVGDEDRFGVSVALSADGSTALVGASGDADAGPDAGAAHVFVRKGGSWLHVAKLAPDDGAPGDRFGVGTSLSADGSTALVGSFMSDAAGENSGAAYVFALEAGSYLQQGKLVAGNGAANQFLGMSTFLSDDGSTALVGFRNAEDPLRALSAYVFERGSGEWGRQTLLQADEGEYGNNLGSKVSLSRDGYTALVGPSHANLTRPDMAHVYVRGSGSWARQGSIPVGTRARDG